MNLSFRLKLALQLSKIGLRDLALGLMAEKTLIEWNGYFAEQVADKRGPLPFDQCILSDEESKLIDYLFTKPGKALVLGCGEGRESVALALRGWKVTAIDQSQKLIIDADAAASESNLSIDFICRDISQGLPRFVEKFDLICMLGQVYNYIPTTTKRIELLKHCKGLLHEEGSLVLTKPMIQTTGQKDLQSLQWRQLFAKLLGGHRNFELGDTWNTRQEFHHKFPSWEDFEREVKSARFMFSKKHTDGLTTLIQPNASEVMI